MTVRSKFWRPVLEYSCELFGTHTKKGIRTKLKKFSAEQLNLFRTILGVKQVSQNCFQLANTHPVSATILPEVVPEDITYTI